MHRTFVSIDDTISNGAFGPFSLGESRESIGEQLGQPTDTALLDRKSSKCIWRYGKIEFYFDNDILTMIHCDSDDLFDGGETLLITSKKFRSGMSPLEAKAILDGRGIRYTDNLVSGSPECVIQTPVGLKFGFVIDGDAGLGPSGLRSWSLQYSG
jgi:hypothetical protein